MNTFEKKKIDDIKNHYSCWLKLHQGTDGSYYFPLGYFENRKFSNVPELALEDIVDNIYIEKYNGGNHKSSRRTTKKIRKTLKEPTVPL